MGAGAAVGGGILSGAGIIAEGQAEARAAFRDAELKEIQADEVINRAKINIRLARLQGQRVAGEQAAAFAKGGVDVSGGSPLLAMEQTSMEISREVQSIAREAEFEARQLKRGAQISRESISDIKAASKLAAVGTVLGAAGKASKFAPKQRGGITKKPTTGNSAGGPLKDFRGHA